MTVYEGNQRETMQQTMQVAHWAHPAESLISEMNTRNSLHLVSTLGSLAIGLAGGVSFSVQGRVVSP